jgi:hypothetical protein
MAVWLALLPIGGLMGARHQWRALTAAAAGAVAIAEVGRRRKSGATVFPLSASLLAPLWLIERAISAWAAVVLRLALGGVPYRGRIVSRAATPLVELRQRLNRV